MSDSNLDSDVFRTWKSSRFIAIDSALVDTLSIVILLTDLEFWSNNINDLLEWCNINGGRVKGMTVEFDDEKHFVLFLLRWS